MVVDVGADGPERLEEGAMAMGRGILVVEFIGVVVFGRFVRYCGRRGLDRNFLGREIANVRGVSGAENE